MTDLMRSMAVDREVLGEAGVSDVAFVRAVNEVANSAELAAAARVAGGATPELLDVVARAVDAELLGRPATASSESPHSCSRRGTPFART
jgi:hypothetical protein